MKIITDIAQFFDTKHKQDMSIRRYNFAAKQYEHLGPGDVIKLEAVEQTKLLKATWKLIIWISCIVMFVLANGLAWLTKVIGASFLSADFETLKSIYNFTKSSKGKEMQLLQMKSFALSTGGILTIMVFLVCLLIALVLLENISDHRLNLEVLKYKKSQTSHATTKSYGADAH